MEIITRNQIQTEALQKFLHVPARRGTICLSTGTGKSKVAIDFIRTVPGIYNILITSPRTNLKENWRKELNKWGLEDVGENIWMINYDGEMPSKFFHIVIENIQTAYKWKGQKFDFIVADEIHTMVTPEYSQLFENNKYTWLMGLTATHDITRKNDKSGFYNRYAPIVYEYYDSADDGLINKTRFKIVDHRLNNNFKVVIKNKNLTFVRGEAEQYEYLTERIKAGQRMMLAQGSDDWFTDAANWFWKKQGSPEQKRAAMMYLNAIKYRKEFLLNLPSSAQLSRLITAGITETVPDSKVLIFSELTAQADKIVKYTIHSHNDVKVNQKMMDDFNEGKIRFLGSCRSLTLGLNLKGASHAIMESYIGSATQSKQKKGRLDRLSTDDVAEMWIIRVLDTQGESWYNEMVKGFDLSEAEYIDSSKILNNEYYYG